MFDPKVFLLTVKAVATLLTFILTGYFLRRKGFLGKDSAKTLSFLCAYLFLPAYNLYELPDRFSRENLGANLLLLGFATAMAVVLIIVGRIAARVLGKSDSEKKVLSYLYTFSNTGYFGLPVIEGVFGSEILGQFLLFTLPFSVAIHSYGWGIFASEKKFNLKKCFLSPTIIVTYLCAFLGLTGLRLPEFIGGAGGILQKAGACMSVAAMLLAGIVMGSKSLKELLLSSRPYVLEIIRIVSVPIIIGVPLYLFGVRGIYLFLAMVVTALPAGMNVIVYPESQGQDSSENSKIVFISTLLSLVAVPLIFSLAKVLSGVGV